MCGDCVVEYMDLEGLLTLTVPGELEPLVGRLTAFYDLPGCGCGGPLHIVLDDTNVEDSNIAFCLESENLADYTAEVQDEAKAIADDLLAIPSLAMRAAVTVAA